MLHIQHQYVGLLSPRLSRFRRVSGSLYNFRCPICGDSATSKTKARGYLYERDGNLLYSCHNCGLNCSFKSLLKRLDEHLADQYALDVFREDRPLLVAEAPKLIKVEPVLEDLIAIEDLPAHHMARKYVISRRIPEVWFKELFYTKAFKEFTNRQLPGKFEDLSYDEERLIIPLYDQTNSMMGYVGRSFDPENKVKYISIILDEEKPKFWGVSHADFNRRYFVTEGPIDAMFLDNAIAATQGKLYSPFNLEHAVLVPDNEPRNPQIVKGVQQAIAQNYAVVIWPDNHPYKDLNDMALGGFEPSQIAPFLDAHTVRGLRAELEFRRWRKC